MSMNKLGAVLLGADDREVIFNERIKVFVLKGQLHVEIDNPKAMLALRLSGSMALAAFFGAHYSGNHPGGIKIALDDLATNTRIVLRNMGKKLPSTEPTGNASSSNWPGW